MNILNIEEITNLISNVYLSKGLKVDINYKGKKAIKKLNIGQVRIFMVDKTLSDKRKENNQNVTSGS